MTWLQQQQTDRLVMGFLRVRTQKGQGNTCWFNRVQLPSDLCQCELPINCEESWVATNKKSQTHTLFMAVSRSSELMLKQKEKNQAENQDFKDCMLLISKMISLKVILPHLLIRGTIFNTISLALKVLKCGPNLKMFVDKSPREVIFSRGPIWSNTGQIASGGRQVIEQEEKNQFQH